MNDNKPVIQGGVFIGGVLTLFEATITFMKAMGWLHTDESQTQAVLVFFRIAFPIVVTLVTTLWMMRHTTSLELPTDKDGTRMVRADDHKPAIKEQQNIKSAIYERSIQREKEEVP